MTERISRKTLESKGAKIGILNIGEYYPNYAITKDGIVYHISQNDASKITICKYTGIATVSLRNQDGHLAKAVPLHKLMLENFCNIENPDIYEVVYKDGDVNNVTLDNLEYYVSKPICFIIVMLSILENFKSINVSDIQKITSSTRKQLGLNKNYCFMMKLYHKQLLHIFNKYTKRELTTMIQALPSDDFITFIGIDDSYYNSYKRSIKPAIMYKYGINNLRISYDILEKFTVSELIKVLELSKGLDVYALFDAKDQILKIKSLDEESVNRVLKIIYHKLLTNTNDAIDTIIEAFECNNISYDHFCYKLHMVKIPIDFIVALSKIKFNKKYASTTVGFMLKNINLAGDING